MSNQDISAELSEAISDLQEALEQAAAASVRIQAALPRIDHISTVFEQLQSVFESGRPNVAQAAQPTPITVAAPKRTRRVESVETPEAGSKTEWQIDTPEPATAASARAEVEAPVPDGNEPTTTFRLEFESRSGPLDLRKVDDAVSQHPSVRDVALLDYDGHRATLKVWVAATVSPAEVQASLTERAAQIGSGNDISIVALEDVA